jgi:hypothetical protein
MVTIDITSEEAEANFPRLEELFRKVARSK